MNDWQKKQKLKNDSEFRVALIAGGLVLIGWALKISVLVGIVAGVTKCVGVW